MDGAALRGEGANLCSACIAEASDHGRANQLDKGNGGLQVAEDDGGGSELSAQERKHGSRELRWERAICYG